MPKLKSVSVTVERLTKAGKTEKSIEQVYVPLDESAWLEPIIESALDHKLLLQDDGKTPHTLETLNVKRDKVRAEFQRREIEANKKRSVM